MMKRMILIVLISMAITTYANAFDFGSSFGFGGVMRAITSPSFALPLSSDLVATPGSTTATFTRASDQSYIAAGTTTLSSVSTGVAAFESAGYLSEPGATNVFLNSAVPVTQLIALTTANSGKWTVTVWGAGTVTSSAGTATASGYGVATAGAPNTVTVTVNGTVVFTVAGADATTRVNVENSTYGTSFIATTGTAAARAATVLSYPMAGNIPSGAWTISLKWTPKVSAGTSTAATIWGSYSDANNYVRLNYNGSILWVEKNIAGVKEYVTKALYVVAGTTYNISIRKNADGTMNLFQGGMKDRGTSSDEYLANTGFDTDTVWTKNNGAVTISGGVGVFTSAAKLDQASLFPGRFYLTVFDLVSRSAGNIKAGIGTSLGTGRSVVATYAEVIQAAEVGSPTFLLVAAGTTTATVDNTSCKEIWNTTTTSTPVIGTTFQIGSDGNGSGQTIANIKDFAVYSIALGDSAVQRGNTPDTVDGKLWVPIGDSTTLGLGVTMPYPLQVGLVAQGLTIVNAGISGSRVSDTGGADCMTNRVDDQQQIADIVTLMGGTNDWAAGVPIGVMADRGLDTFYGSLHNACINMQARYPGKKLALFTPLPRQNSTVPINGKILSDFTTAIKTVAAYYSIPVLDLFATVPINPDDASQRTAYMPDGLHPNNAGYALISALVVPFLRGL
jgi:lysophospholipase L1-like esterase